MRFERGGAAIRHQKFAWFTACFGQAIRKSQSENPAAGIDWRFHFRMTCLARPASRKPPCIFGALRRITAKALDPLGKVCALSAETALGDEGGYIDCKIRFAFVSGMDHHARQTRRQGKGTDGTALIRQSAVSIERAYIFEEHPCFIERRARRRIEPFQSRGWIAYTPGGEVEEKA
jgi:hypothetical protein